MKKTIIVTIVIAILCYLFGAMLRLYVKEKKKTSFLQEELSYYNDSLNTYISQYPSTEFSSLRTENNKLYKQLKEKDDLIEAIQFKYNYLYKGKEEIVSDSTESDSLHHFVIQNDTMGYDLKIWSPHVYKYRLLFNLTNEFTITRQRLGNDWNRTEISSAIPGKIENVTIWTAAKEKRSRFSIGPSIGVGYGFINRKPDIYLGVTLTWNLWQK